MVSLALVAVEGPKLDRYVFCRIAEDIGEFEVLSEEGVAGATVTMSAGDVFVIRYSAVRSLVAAKRAELI